MMTCARLNVCRHIALLFPSPSICTRSRTFTCKANKGVRMLVHMSSTASVIYTDPLRMRTAAILHFVGCYVLRRSCCTSLAKGLTCIWIYGGLMVMHAEDWAQ